MSIYITSSGSSFNEKRFLHKFKIIGLSNDDILLGVKITYSLNEIPEATLLYPATKQINARIGTSIKIHYDGKLLFDGYITGTSFNRESGNALLQINVVSSYIDLAALSFYSTGLVSSNLWDTESLLCVSSAAQRLSIPLVVFSQPVSQLLNALTEFIRQISNSTRFRSGIRIPTEALIATRQQLKKIKIDLPMHTSRLVEYSAATIIGSTLTDMVNGGSIWTLLTTLSEVFGFMIRPTATAIHLTPLVFDHRHLQRISQDEIATGSSQRSNLIPIRGLVFISQGQLSLTSVLPEGFNMPVYMFDTGSAGAFYPEVIPAWLNHFSKREITNAHIISDSSIDSNNANVSRAVNTNVSATADQRESTLRSVCLSTVKSVLSDWAKWRYFIRSFATSKAEFLGPFRLDIAPGNCIQCLFSDAKGQAANKINGIVTSVTCEANAPSHYAGTLVEIGWAHHSTETTYVGTHPIFTSQHKNFSLV